MAPDDTKIRFTVHPDDADLLQEMIDEYGDGEPDRFLREAVRILATAKRTERLDTVRQKIAADLGGRTFSTNEVIEMCKGRSLPGQPRTRPRRDQES